MIMGYNGGVGSTLRENNKKKKRRRRLKSKIAV